MKEEKFKKDNPVKDNTISSNTAAPNQSILVAKNQENTKIITKGNLTSENKQSATTSNSKNSSTIEIKQTEVKQGSTASNQHSSTINQQKENKTEMKNEQKETSDKNETVSTPLTSKERLSEANHIVKNRMIASVGAGLIPFPVVDIVALTGIQMDTVRALAKLYEIKFSKDIGKTAVGTLTGAVLPVAVGPWVSSLAKTLPVVGQIMGSISMPVIAGASTYAIGKVFIQHFESGGTFLTFDPDKVKGYFQEEFEKGKEFAKAEAKIS